MDRPNIILVNCDDLGYGDIGCYGSTVHSTPALDRLAAEGLRFTDFYMAAPVCSPSRAAMMTGCYPQRIGLESGEEICVLRPGESIGLSPAEITMADVLKSAGYTTKIIGKWHCGDQPEFLPTRHGFDSWFGLPYSNDMGISVHYPDRFPPLPLMRDEDVIQVQPDQAALTERYTQEAVDFIRHVRQDPFFLYLAHMYVHVPLYAPERFLKQSRNGPYGAAVEHVDFVMAVLLHELETLGIDDRTLVIFTSDNGGAPRFGASNAPLRGQKGETWEGGMRVPCLMRWPGTIPPAAESGHLCTAMDFLPTFARLAGVSPPDDRILDGRDLGRILVDPANAEDVRDAFFYYREHELQAVRSGDWKYHLRTGELYHLRRDIGETQDRAAEHPDIVARLESLAARCRADLGDSLTGTPGAHCRPCGRVDRPRPLVKLDPDCPLMIAMYD